MAYALLVAVGLLTGVLGGMLGIGGSIIMLPAMVWILGAFAVVDGRPVEQLHQYMAAAMAVNFLLSIPSVMAHWKNKAIWPKVVKFLMLGGVPGVLLGVDLSLLFSQHPSNSVTYGLMGFLGADMSGFTPGGLTKYLRQFLGMFFIYVAIENLYRVYRGPRSDRSSRKQVEGRSWLSKFGIGGFVGTFAGLTGLGGGALAVPAQQYVLNAPIRNAIANSSALIASIAWVGAIAKNVQLGPDGTIARSLLLVACLAPTAMIGAYVGGHLTHNLPIRFIRLAFALLILASSYRLLFPEDVKLPAAQSTTTQHAAPPAATTPAATRPAATQPSAAEPPATPPAATQPISGSRKRGSKVELRWAMVLPNLSTAVRPQLVA